jgi:hypothetical protein
VHNTTLGLLDMPGFGNRWLFRDGSGKESHVDVDGNLKTSNYG